MHISAAECAADDLGADGAGGRDEAGAGGEGGELEMIR